MGAEGTKTDIEGRNISMGSADAAGKTYTFFKLLDLRVGLGLDAGESRVCAETR